MAKYNDIIDEFKTVADAFSSVNYFIYNRVSEVNGRLQDKAYPMILVNSSPNFERGANNSYFLPRNKRFTFNIFLYNTFNKADQEAETLQERQAEVDNLLDQYIAELMSRNIEGSRGFSIINATALTGFLAHDVHNDRLIQSTYTITVELDSDCTTGTFTY
jgi:hypothetical protein